jgi:hypothetical protein
MKALTWHGKGDMRCESCRIRASASARRDIKVPACAAAPTCTLRRHHPSMKRGDVLGHETRWSRSARRTRAYAKAAGWWCRLPSPAENASSAGAGTSREASSAPIRTPKWRPSGGPLAGVWLFASARWLPRRTGGVSAGAVRRCQPGQGAGLVARRAGAVPLRHIPTRRYFARWRHLTRERMHPEHHRGWTSRRTRRQAGADRLGGMREAIPHHHRKLSFFIIFNDINDFINRNF